jgi:uncharacterized iron-regulated membrane protein
MKGTAMDTKVLAQRKSLFWRIHLWAAFLATPFALIGALTGILYIFTPQIEARLHGHLDRVTPGDRALPLDALVALAQQAAPRGAVLRYVVTPETAEQSVRVYFGPASVRPAMGSGEHSDHAEHNASALAAAKLADGSASAKGLTTTVESATKKDGMRDRIPKGNIVYIDPYSGRVLGMHGEMDRFSMWAKRLHSSLLQGNDWRWMLELSTSWLLVMLLTGIYLWWPRGASGGLPSTGLKDRTGWKQWHAFVGVVLSVITLVMLVTGLTWSRHSGQQIRAAADWMGQGQPAAPKGLRSVPQPGQAPLGWQEVWNAARKQAPSISYQLTPPKTLEEPWRITNFDRSQPLKRFNLELDGYSGKVLYYAGWDSFTLFNKATAVGIPFHRGEFGLWNQALLLVFGLGVLWALLSGWVMFFKRTRQGLLGLPRLLPGALRTAPAGAWVTAAFFVLAMPVWALSLVPVALTEAALGWRNRCQAAA